jgi:hypothetical protein
MKTSTMIIAKKTSCCPLCFNIIKPGERTKVYRNAWYHPACADSVYTAVLQKKELQNNLNGVK